jgi:hypothetical protein
MRAIAMEQVSQKPSSVLKKSNDGLMGAKKPLLRVGLAPSDASEFVYRGF